MPKRRLVRSQLCLDAMRRAAGQRELGLVVDEQLAAVDPAPQLAGQGEPVDAVLVALRRICRETLILRTSTIPEVRGLPNAAVYFPMLDARSRELWNLKSLGLLHQAGISREFEPSAGYGNWFWGLTPSSVEAMLRATGFEVLERYTYRRSVCLVCRPC